MPVLIPPKPGGDGKAANTATEVWTLKLKKGEVLNVEYEK
jgi:hypothetical protein